MEWLLSWMKDLQDKVVANYNQYKMYFLVGAGILVLLVIVLLKGQRLKLDIDDMELLERLRKKLDLVEAFWWFAENSVDGLCCSNTVNSQKEVRGA